MDFIFNELSFNDLCADSHAGKSRMQNLLQVCKRGREVGMSRLAIRPDFYERSLSVGYSVNNWLNDNTVSKILKDLLLSIVRQPYIDNNDAVIEEQFISSYAYLINEEMSLVEGLAVAYLYKTMAVSFNSSEAWNVYELNLKFSEVGYDDQVVKVNHASQIHHIEQHRDWIGSRIGIKLPVTDLLVSQKEINLRNDHGKDVLLRFSKKLVRSQYVTKVVNSLPFNNFDKDFIRQCYGDGKIEIVLVRSDQGLGVVIQTTGRNLSETKAIAAILNEEFHNTY